MCFSLCVIVPWAILMPEFGKLLLVELAKNVTELLDAEAPVACWLARSANRPNIPPQ